jgi:hypothetical protein
VKAQKRKHSPHLKRSASGVMMKRIYPREKCSLFPYPLP